MKKKNCFSLAATDPAVIAPMNFNLSNLFSGASLIVQCPVESCVENVTVQLFEGNVLLREVIVSDPSKEIAQFQFAASGELAGEYRCQALSTFMGDLFSSQASFIITGVHICCNRTLLVSLTLRPSCRSSYPNTSPTNTRYNINYSYWYS